jgi:hypothetical protein
LAPCTTYACRIHRNSIRPSGLPRLQPCRVSHDPSAARDGNAIGANSLPGDTLTICSLEGPPSAACPIGVNVLSASRSLPRPRCSGTDAALRPVRKTSGARPSGVSAGSGGSPFEGIDRGVSTLLRTGKGSEGRGRSAERRSCGFGRSGLGVTEEKPLSRGL